MACAIDYYPNTDRMKTTVQHSPQIILEGALLLPEPQTPKEVRASSFIAREFIRDRQSSCIPVYEYHDSMSSLPRHLTSR